MPEPNHIQIGEVAERTGSALIEWRKPLGFGLEETREPLERLDRSDSAEIFLQERKPLSEGLDVLETAIA